ncbi:hypothetical protein BS78_03G243900 [Paspalum vaginatum]|nr:hypothetical protein BS78_03G243900 [Paspalum vaginatum]
MGSTRIERLVPIQCTRGPPVPSVRKPLLSLHDTGRHGGAAPPPHAAALPSSATANDATTTVSISCVAPRTGGVGAIRGGLDKPPLHRWGTLSSDAVTARRAAAVSASRGHVMSQVLRASRRGLFCSYSWLFRRRRRDSRQPRQARPPSSLSGSRGRDIVLRRPQRQQCSCSPSTRGPGGRRLRDEPGFASFPRTILLLVQLLVRSLMLASSLSPVGWPTMLLLVRLYVIGKQEREATSSNGVQKTN